MIRYDRQILALDDDGLEAFVTNWINKKKSDYVEVERFTGPGDMGRDVVGFLTKDRHEGSWHNYQCKQLGRTLQPGSAIFEIGKILYFSYIKKFTAPSAYFFVAPRGVSRTAENLIFNPGAFKQAVLENWGKHCEKKIVQGTAIPLDAPLRAHITAYDFSRISKLTIHNILADPAVKPVLVERFGADPGPPPKGITPADVQPFETPYIRQLLDAYGERDHQQYASHGLIQNHPEHGPHLRHQRERFFQADSFNRHYRDNTMPEELAQLHDDVYHGIIQTHSASHADSLTRVDATMEQAAIVHPGGPLAKHARVPVKQGICHHFANDGLIKWKK